jgi:hypothetical protein
VHASRQAGKYCSRIPSCSIVVVAFGSQAIDKRLGASTKQPSRPQRKEGHPPRNDLHCTVESAFTPKIRSSRILSNIFPRERRRVLCLSEKFWSISEKGRAGGVRSASNPHTPVEAQVTPPDVFHPLHNFAVTENPTPAAVPCRTLQPYRLH